MVSHALRLRKRPQRSWTAAVSVLYVRHVFVWPPVAVMVALVCIERVAEMRN
jgi:hypothetical protein